MQKCVVAKVPFLVFLFLSFFLVKTTMFNNNVSNSLNTHCHFSTKVMLITVQSSTTTQHLRSFKLTLVNESHSQHSVAVIHCEGCHFLILYTCAHVVSFPELMLDPLMCSSCPSEAVAAKSITRHHILCCWSLIKLISFKSYLPFLVQTSRFFLARLSTSLIAVPNLFSGSGSGSAVEQGMELPLSGQDTLQLQTSVRTMQG